MRNGSKAWMLRPVGRMSGLRIRSPPGHRPDEAAAERAQQRRHLGVLRQQRSRAARASPRPSGIASRCSVRASPVSGRPTTCSPSGISAFSVSSRVDPEPVGIGAAGEVDRLGLVADQPGELAALGGRRRASAAPARQAVLELQQALVEAGPGQRRGQVADQHRAGAALGERALGGIVGGIEIDVGQVADQPVGPAIGAEAGLLAGHEFQRARAVPAAPRSARRPPSSRDAPGGRGSPRCRCVRRPRGPPRSPRSRHRSSCPGSARAARTSTAPPGPCGSARA